MTKNSGGSSFITVCNVTAGTGSLEKCAPYTSGTFSYPAYTLIVGKNIYISNFVGNQLSVCELDTMGNLITATCQRTGPIAGGPIGLGFAFGRLYIGPSQVQMCNIAPGTGELVTPCTSTGTGFADIAGAVVSAIDSTFFVVNNVGYTTSCKIAVGTGLLSNCTNSGANMQAPYAIAAAPYTY